MLKQFCPECGFKHEFMDKRPKFCTECGYSFTSVARKVVQEPVETEEFEEEFPDYNIPKLDVSELGMPRRPMTIADAMANPVAPVDYNRPTAGAKGLKQLQRDVKIRKGKDIGGK